jgi:hypothetical protein
MRTKKNREEEIVPNEKKMWFLKLPFISNTDVSL